MLDSAFPQLYCLKFSFKSIEISKSYARKHKEFFMKRSVYCWSWHGL